MKRKLLSWLLVICLLTSFAVTFAAPAADVEGRWSEQYITALQELGIMEGYPDGSFKPTRNIKKSELVTLLNRAFGLTAGKEISYRDVSADAWYYAQFEKAANYVFTWDDNMVYPEKMLSREEAAAMFAKLMGFQVSSTEDTVFSDDESIGDWAKDYIYGSVAKQIITGYPNDNTFRPEKNITREEIATVLCKLLGHCITEAGTVTEQDDSYDNVTVMSGDVTLDGLHIAGDLYLTAAVGNGTVTLKDCTVDGEIIAVGGYGTKLVITGESDSLQVRGDGLEIEVRGHVEELIVNTSDHQNAQITIDDDGTLEALNMQTAGTVVGKVQVAFIAVDGVTLTELPDRWELEDDVSVTIDQTLYTTSGEIGLEFSTGFPTMDVQVIADGTRENVTLAFRMEETASIYCIAVPKGSPAPTSAQIQAMKDYGTVKLAAGNFAVYDDTTVTKLMELKNLEYSKAYDLYIVAAKEDDTSKVCVPVQLTIEAPFFTADSPTLYGVTAETASICVKMVNDASVYMLALPMTEEAPDAEQLVKLGIRTDLKAGEERLMTAEDLKDGALNYTIYLGAAAVGEMPETLQAFEMTNAGNTVKVSYSQKASVGLYPIYTTLTLHFGEKVYKSGTDIQLGAIGAEPTAVIGITAEKSTTKTVVSTTGVTMTPVNNTILIAPPAGGWQYDTTYTLNLSGVTDIKGQTIQPVTITFSTEKEEDALASPRISVKSGTAVPAGTKFILNLDNYLQKQGAIIRYTTDDTDPLTSDTARLVMGDTNETISIPEDAKLGSTFCVRAITQLSNEYSAEMKAVYTIENPLLKPIVTLSETGEELISGSSVQNDTRIKLEVLKTTANLYYTADGTDPIVSGEANNSYTLTLSGENGSVILIKAILVYGDYTSRIYTFSYTIAEEADILPTMTPIISLRRSGDVFLDGETYEVKETDFLCVYSCNDYNYTSIYYTLDGSDPAKSATRQELKAATPGTILQIPMQPLQADTTVKLRLLAYNSGTGMYSGERTLNMCRTA